MKLFRSLAVVALLCAPLSALAAPVEYLNADGINRTPVSVANPLPVTGGTGGGGGGASSQAAVAFRQTCTASAVQMASNTFANGAVISVISGAGVAYIGPSGVTTSTGFPISTNGTVPLSAISYGVANSNQLYLICSDTSTVVAVTGN